MTSSHTYVNALAPWGLFLRNGHRLLCSDGKVRAAELSPVADTYFSIPATVRVHGVRVTGYATTEERADGRTVYAFRRHDAHAATLPDWPARHTPEFTALLNS